MCHYDVLGWVCKLVGSVGSRKNSPCRSLSQTCEPSLHDAAREHGKHRKRTWQAPQESMVSLSTIRKHGKYRKTAW